MHTHIFHLVCFQICLEFLFIFTSLVWVTIKFFYFLWNNLGKFSLPLSRLKPLCQPQTGSYFGSWASCNLPGAHSIVANHTGLSQTLAQYAVSFSISWWALQASLSPSSLPPPLYFFAKAWQNHPLPPLLFTF